MANCTICDQELTERTRMPTCSKCRAHFGRWRPRSVKDQMGYKDALVIRSIRMAVLVDIPKKGHLLVEEGSTAIQDAKKKFGSVESSSNIIPFPKRKKTANRITVKRSARK